MSLILDALNKADQERSERREVPGLRAVHGSPSPAPRMGAVKRWSVEIGFVAVLLIAFLVFELVVKDARPPPARPATLDAYSAQQTPPPQTEPSPATVAPVVVATPVAAATVPAAIVASAVEAPQTSAPAADVKALYAAQLSGSQPAREVLPPQASAPSPTGLAAAPAAQSSQPADAALEMKARLGKLPLLSELSEQKQRAIPSIDFSLHVYSSEQSTGFVTLNGQRRRPGDTIGSGLRLESIVDEFIVLNYQGTRFRLLSLNSWINLQ